MLCVYVYLLHIQLQSVCAFLFFSSIPLICALLYSFRVRKTRMCVTDVTVSYFFRVCHSIHFSAFYACPT